MIKSNSLASRIALGMLGAGLLRAALWLLRGPRGGHRSDPSLLQRAHPQVPDTGAYTPNRTEP